MVHLNHIYNIADAGGRNLVPGTDYVISYKYCLLFILIFFWAKRDMQKRELPRQILSVQNTYFLSLITFDLSCSSASLISPICAHTASWEGW